MSTASPHPNFADFAGFGGARATECFSALSVGVRLIESLRTAYLFGVAANPSWSIPKADKFLPRGSSALRLCEFA